MAVVSKHVLIVDDSSAIRRCLREALTARKWQICGEAVNGQDAIEKARRLKPDLSVKWLTKHKPVLQFAFDGLRKAGLPEE